MFRKLNPTAELLNAWSGLGYEPDSWKLVVFAPIVQTAWADGFLQAVEKREILSRARRFGIKLESAADRRLADWLESRPPDPVFETAREILSGFLRSLSPEQNRKLADYILKNCLEIARASRGIGLIRKNHPAVGHEETRQLNELSRFLSLRDAAGV